MTTPLTLLQARVYFTIRQHGAMGPTALGYRLGFQYDLASASVARPLKHLVNVGLLKSIGVNKRLLVYEVIVHENPPIIQIMPRKASDDVEEYEEWSQHANGRSKRSDSSALQDG